MHYINLKSVNKTLLFLRFGKIRLDQGLYEIEMEFMILKAPITSKEIVSFNYLKYFSEETLSVWAPYKIIGETTPLDIYVNGERVKRLCDITPKRTLYFNKPLIKYQFCLENIFTPTSDLEKAFTQQHFAYFRIEKENKYWVIPCSEIYTSYFGKFQSAILQATFEGIQIYDNELTVAVNKEFPYPPYIKLRKQFTKASVKIAYRMYKDKNFESAFKKTRTLLHTDDKNLYSEFPFRKTNELVVNYIAISKTVNCVVQIKSIKSDFVFPDELEYDTDNSPGEEVDENTAKVPVKRVKGIPLIEDKDLSFSVNQPNSILPLNAVNVRPDEDMDVPTKIKKVTKEKKKTISEKVTTMLQSVDEDSYGGASFKRANTIERSHESETSSSPSIYSFENLENLIGDLLNSNEFLSVNYYSNKSSYELTTKNYNGSTNWPYLEKNRKTQHWEGHRKIGLIELNFRKQIIYVLEIEKRRESESFSLGIIYSDIFSIMTEAQFMHIKENLIAHRGSLQKMFLKKRLSNSNVNGTPLNHTNGKTKMVDRIINQIKAIVPK